MFYYYMYVVCKYRCIPPYCLRVYASYIHCLGTPTPKDKYGPGRNIIIGVVVGVIAVLLVLIIIVALVILIVVKCGKKKFKISKLDFNHR